MKNNLLTAYEHYPVEVRAYIKAHCLVCMADPSKMIRDTVGTLLTTMVSKAGIIGWPELLPHLLACLDSQDYNVIEGALGALHKICEDSADQLEDARLGRPLATLIPKFLQFFRHPHAKIRSRALSSVNLFINDRSQALMVYIDEFIQVSYNVNTFTNRFFVCVFYCRICLN